jgi:hypothetical protein
MLLRHCELTGAGKEQVHLVEAVMKSLSETFCRVLASKLTDAQTAR